ncbi:TonB-dependent receptor domain-containing protein [Noviherbaspirillum sp.]|uniref:TonB-dependent receptor domain-containing protein n=1 Tax=Noviherbaspirillum sp. TaxID=1926288 RepID=UPI002B49EA76|nr:TonB-dependent receptor [Noviherbaspirillum sp.]HJV82365.1 TonB-dependent receptor [Noviherbaspirillum sp.]
MARIAWAISLACIVAGTAGTACAQALTRRVDTVGQVVASKGDEQLNPVEMPGWRRLDVQQSLAEGDNLRTGAYGGLSVLFRDETQIRIHANTTLQIKNIGRRTQGNTRLHLERGGVWMRAKTVPSGLSIDTPSATVSVRGTDWSLTSDDKGASALTVLSGQVRFFNEFGEVLVERGEAAFAEKGKAPVKRYIVQPKDQAQWQLSTGWIDLISLTGDTATALREKLSRTPSVGASSLLRAQQAFDMMEYEQAQRLLAQARTNGEPAGRIALVDGLIALQQERIDDAEQLLDKAMPEGRRERMALRLGHYGVLIRKREFVRAGEELDSIGQEFGDFAEVALAHTWRLAFRGELEQALAVAADAMQRFPHEVRFPIILAHLHMLLGDAPQMRKQLDAGQALDPVNPYLQHLDALYHVKMLPDPQRAKQRALRAIELAPGYAQLWNDLGLACQDLGDNRGAEAALRRAIELMPSAPEFHANLATLLITQDRLEEAEALLRHVVDTHPALATGPEGLGLVALARGKNEEALDWLLKAVLLNPGLSEAQTLLAVAYYRDERFKATDSALDSAIRYDVNTPLPHLLKSLIAQDQAEAGKAIRYARSAFDIYMKSGEASIDGVQNSQSGNSGLASAYGNLGLANWGDFLSQRAYNPYWANSHFSAGTLYESSNARLGSLMQGLLLDPSAVSSTPRYSEFGPRRPHHDLMAGASFASEAGHIANSQSVTALGFVRDGMSPSSLSYFVSASRNFEPGTRTNADARNESVTAALGATPNADTGVLLRLSASRTKNGLPGSLSAPDFDDRADATSINGNIGLHRRLGYHDELLLSAFAARDRNRLRNADPYGNTLSPLDYSLVTQFGLEQTRDLYRQGIVDATFDPAFPTYVVGATMPGWTGLATTLPAGLDLDTRQSQKALARFTQLQAKRLLDIGPLQASYGAEWAWSGSRIDTMRTTGRVDANGILVFSDIGAVPPAMTGGMPDPTFPAVFFPYATPLLQAQTNSIANNFGQVYASARWPISSRLLLDAGLKLQHTDDGTRNGNRTHPHVGIAWTVAENHWLRAAYQRQSGLPMVGSLGPMTTVGLGVADAYVANGGVSTSRQLQWDSEWNERLMSFVRVGEQDVDGFAMPSANPWDVLLARGATVRSVAAGANLWLGERWGLAATWRQVHSVNHDAANAGKSLPLMPERTFNFGATWVHPAQIRFSLAQSYTGPTQADLANTTKLAGYWITNASINWQPAPKHWSWTLSVSNLFDRRYRVARDYPGIRRTLLLGLEYRS